MSVPRTRAIILTFPLGIIIEYIPVVFQFLAMLTCAIF